MDITIDFTVKNTDPKCVKLYSDSEEYTEYRCYTDFGRGISVESLDGGTVLISGTYCLVEQEFTIKSHDGEKYIFLPLAD